MPDRENLLSYAGLLLRRMNELSDSSPKDKAELERVRKEARRLRERWQSCMRILSHISDKGNSRAWSRKSRTACIKRQTAL
jgi:hypothetical protein